MSTSSHIPHVDTNAYRIISFKKNHFHLFIFIIFNDQFSQANFKINQKPIIKLNLHRSQYCDNIHVLIFVFIKYEKDLYNLCLVYSSIPSHTFIHVLLKKKKPIRQVDRNSAFRTNNKMKLAEMTKTGPIIMIIIHHYWKHTQYWLRAKFETTSGFYYIFIFTHQNQ